MKRVIVAKTAGFCMGVKRAVDMVMDLLGKTNGPVYTYGPLIHNPQVTELLAKKGVIIIDKNKIPKKGTVIIRTHGIEPGIRRRFEESGIKIYDATCPFVIKVQRIIEEYSKKGYTIVIVGDRGHAEVDSYLGCANGKGMVFSSADEINKAMPFLSGNVCVVAQTTQDKNRFNEIMNKLKKHSLELKVFDTICSATSRRQEEALKISYRVNAMIVVGGRNSANTLRLVEICRLTNIPTHFIERAEDLKLNNMERYNTIGITAGASTSKETISEIVDYLRNEIQDRGKVSTKGMEGNK